MKASNWRKQRYLTLREISPVVEWAACWRTNEDFLGSYRNPTHHLILVDSGQIEGSTPTRHFKAVAGDLICIPPAERIQYATRGPTASYQTHVEFAPPPRHRLTPWLEEIGPLPLIVSVRKAFNPARRIFETLCIELGRDGIAPQLRVRAAVHELLAIIVDVSSAKRISIRHLDDWQRAQLRLDSELGAHVSVDQLASQMGISKEHFIREFKQRFGISPKAYHTHARIREATRLLRSTHMSVKAIAYELGFADPKSFMRLLKKHLGVVSSDLRSAIDVKPKRFIKRGNALFSINKHIVPPHAKPDWLSKYDVRQIGS